MSHPQPLRGAIVRAERFVGIAMGEAEGGIIVVPAVKGPGRHRSDVRHSEPLIPSDLLIRTGAVQICPGRLTVGGRVSSETLAAIDAAMAREVRAVQFESRFVPRDHTERAVRM